MAKKNDQLAGVFEAENTGGLLSGLLADEEHLDRRAMFRLGSWGVASVGAVVIAVLANQSAIKTRRDDIASLDLTRQSQQIQSVARESQNESRRLASAIDTLNSDRDRLYSRLTTIEQGLDSVTGAIAKQKVVAAVPPGTPPAAPTVSPPASAPVPQPIAQTAAADPAPAVAPVTTSVAPMTTSVASMTASAAATPERPAPEKPRADAKKPAPPAAVIVAAPPPDAAASSNPPANAPAPSSVAPLMASKSLMGPPDAAAVKLIEPEPPAKVAAAAPSSPPPSLPTPASTAAAPAHAPEVTASKPAPDKSASEKVAAAPPVAPVPAPLAVKHTEFGVDVGGANSVAGLRALWRGLLKSRSNAPLAALQPIIVVKERDNGLGMQLRLVAGPLSDAAAAARICARLAENEHPCETSLFDGQRLAFKSDEAPARTESISAKPERPSAERRSEEKSAPEATSAEKPEPEKPAATKPGSNRYFHRRSYYQPKRAAAVVEEPPKKPETTSSISSFFSSRLHPQ